MSNITENTDQLETNAVAIAKGYFTASREGIDTAFGKGFAKGHPELIAAYMRTAAIDLQTLVRFCRDWLTAPLTKPQS
jgi:hypothetical protein